MARGKVKWYNENKGFGFITPDDGSEDVFALYKDIKIPGVRALHEGQYVQYDVETGPKGKQAVNIFSLDN